MMHRSTSKLYTRMSLFLPCKTPEELSAFFEILEYLDGEKGNPTLPPPVTGYTYSDYSPPVFMGAWYYQGKWIKDHHTLLLIDYECTSQSDELKDALYRLNKTLVDCYLNNNCEQDAFWIITNPVSLYTEIKM